MWLLAPSLVLGAGSIERGAHGDAGGSGSGGESTVPNRHQETGVGEGEGTRQMDGVGSSERTITGEPPGGLLHLLGQLDRSDGVPEVVEGGERQLEVLLGQVAVPVGCGECCADLRMGEPAGEGGVAPVPQGRGEVAPVLVDSVKTYRSACRAAVVAFPGRDAAG